MDRLTAGKMAMLTLEQEGLHGFLDYCKKLEVKPILPQIPAQLLLMLLKSNVMVEVKASAYA